MSQITDQIREQVDIVELVREYVPSLKKAGTSWKAPCPFHQEKTPSFIVSPVKQIWHCFGCSRGGDVFGFIKETEGIEFRDALRLLAKRAGVKLERQDPKAESERTRLLDMLRLSASWYHQALLKAKSGDKAREYLTKRNVKSETQSTWQLGFSPDAWEGLTTYLHSRGYLDQEIVKAGLASANDRGGLYDRFRNRLMFPITDVHGSVIGFTARKLNEEDIGGKYINTPETSIYHKSSVLYGLSRAKQEIRKQDLAVVVEGNMDCISSHEAGVTNVVASSGTALTSEQIQLLKRYTKNIALAFDPDIAGQDALMRGLEVAWRADMSISVISLPEGVDPDDLIKKSSEEWQKAIESRVELMDWVFNAVSKQHDMNSAQGKKQAAGIILAWIARIPDPIEQTHYLQKLSNIINVNEEMLRSIIAKKNASSFKEPQPESNNTNQPKKDIIEQAGIRLLGLMSSDKLDIALEEDLLANSQLRELYKSRIELYDCRIDELPQDLQALGREIIMLSDDLGSSLTKEEREQEIGQIINRLKSSSVRNKLSSLREQIRAAEEQGDTQSLDTYLAQYQNLNKELSANPKSLNQ
ncbi:DNA primase [bacterium]|jgi:DNA primase|nr:DNA primase [bacterium]MDP6571699.1 DNA primase [Patescibacteria group bacterium]|tara:strand:- start:4234 stop:5985 length:1752 start_codon:yes stop_codon:yes gene_type:complete